MTFDVAIHGRVWVVGVEPGERAGRFAVTVNGRMREVDAAWIDDNTVSLVDGLTARELRIDPRAGGALDVTVGERRFDVAVSQERRKRPRVLAGVTPNNGRGAAVKSPMPGRIVRVLARVGDRVMAGAPLVVVEAMKMENELRAPADGVVKQVNVETGAAVETGAVLIVIE